MFADLKNVGFTVEETHEGICSITGSLCVPAQIVVIPRLPEGEYEEFKILAPKAKRKDVVRFLDKASKHPGEHASAILRVSMAANQELYRKLVGEEGSMKDVFESIFHKELLEKESRGRSEGRADIISRMLKRGMTPEQVADLIALPVAEVLALRGGSC